MSHNISSFGHFFLFFCLILVSLSLYCLTMEQETPKKKKVLEEAQLT